MMKNKGITLLALVITIIVLLILAGVTIASITGNSGVLEQAKRASIVSEFSKYKEEFENFKNEKQIDNVAKGEQFEEQSLSAGKSVLYYNTMPDEEKYGNIKNVIPSMRDKYIDNFIIIKGELLFNSDNESLVKIASDLGINKSDWDIIGGRLLSSNRNLKLQDQDGTITIPSIVTSIEEGAFANVDVTKVVIPYTVKEIKQNAFAYNSKIQTVEFQTRKNKDGNIEGCERLGNNVFSNCSNLRNVKLPESLTSLGENSFYSCTNLKEITIPNSVTEIPASCFYKAGLINIILDSNLNKIGPAALAATNLTEITIPESVNYIDSALWNNNNLKTVNLNCKHIEYFNSDCFSGTKITAMNIASGSNVNWYVQHEEGKKDVRNLILNGNQIIFIYAADLADKTTYKVPDGITSFIYELPRNISKLYLSASVNELSPDLFRQIISDIEVDPASKDYKVVTDNNSNKILYQLLSDEKNCNVAYVIETKSSEIEIPNKIIVDNEERKVDKINYFAFDKMLGGAPAIHVNKITLNARNISNRCFGWGSTQPQTVEIGENVEIIDPLFNRDGYNYNLIVNSNNKKFTVKDNILYEKINNEYVLKRAIIKPDKSSDATITIPEEVNGRKITSINAAAFYNEDTITKIKIPSTINSIGADEYIDVDEEKKEQEKYRESGAFGYCSSLKEVTISSNIKKIGKHCFEGCVDVESININITRAKAQKIGLTNNEPFGAIKGTKVIKYK